MDIYDRLQKEFDAHKVSRDDQLMAEVSIDQTECPGRRPLVVVQPTTPEEIVTLVKVARELKTPLTPRVAGTNLGGLALPSTEGILVDLRNMNRIIELNEIDQYCILEPGVTFGQLSERLAETGDTLTVAYPLAPPEASVVLNCILDGLGNLSLLHGSMGQWLTGLEAVLGTGEVIKTGSWALSPIPFARAPLPDLTGLFINLQGTTGIVTKGVVELWPAPAIRQRLFLLMYSLEEAYTLIRELVRTDICSDMGGLTWPTSRLMFSAPLEMELGPGEPEIFLYLDIPARDQADMKLKRKWIKQYLAGHLERGVHIDGPLDLNDIVKIEPAFNKFATFPTRLDFLLDNPLGGLTWVGTYGPLSKFDESARTCTRIMQEDGFPPMLVSRPMKGGHFGVLRYIYVFDKNNGEECDRVRKNMERVMLAALEDGFIMYKTPPWALKMLAEKIDPTFLKTVAAIKALHDPDSILAPGLWPT